MLIGVGGADHMRVGSICHLARTGSVISFGQCGTAELLSGRLERTAEKWETSFRPPESHNRAWGQSGIAE